MSVKEMRFLIRQAWDHYDMGIISRETLMSRLDGYLLLLENEGATEEAKELRERYVVPKRKGSCDA